MSHRDARNSILLLFGLCFVVCIVGFVVGYMATQNLGWSLVTGLGAFATTFGLFWLKLTRG
jgi:hypothetical protein